MMNLKDIAAWTAVAIGEGHAFAAGETYRKFVANAPFEVWARFAEDDEQFLMFFYAGHEELKFNSPFPGELVFRPSDHVDPAGETELVVMMFEPSKPKQKDLSEGRQFLSIEPPSPVHPEVERAIADARFNDMRRQQEYNRIRREQEALKRQLAESMASVDDPTIPRDQEPSEPPGAPEQDQPPQEE